MPTWDLRAPYSEQAAVDYDPDALRVPYPSIPAVFRAADNGEVEQAIVPIENSVEGVVTYTVDLLINESDLKIRNEIVVPIHHYLLSEPDTAMEDVRVVYSHPQAIAQCRRYLSSRLPNAEHVASLSTAGAVDDMRNSERPAAAISSRRAADIFGATIFGRQYRRHSEQPDAVRGAGPLRTAGAPARIRLRSASTSPRMLRAYSTIRLAS